jgi:hypothetical protein
VPRQPQRHEAVVVPGAVDMGTQVLRRHHSPFCCLWVSQMSYPPRPPVRVLMK